MRERLGILIVEMADGKVGFQAVESADAIRESFEQMAGRPGDARSRASLVSLEWGADGKPSVSVESKVLPVPREEPPWGVRLGAGEMEEPKEEEEDEGD